MIEIEELYKYYGSRRAVGPLSVEIASGEVVGLLGLNGAGKTTVLRILACDLLPTSGRVLVGGIDVVDNPQAVRANIGYLPDTPPLYHDMTVREFLTYAAMLRGVRGAELERRVAVTLGLTETTQVAGDLIGTLSHGFRQRVGIAQAVVHGPQLVVLDEPISGLDPVQIVEMRRLIRNLRGEHTVVVSSHILSEISETCDRILVIRDGVIVAAGTESELSSRFLRGMVLQVTFQRPAQLDEQAAVALMCPPESGATATVETPAEPGERITTVRVQSEGDPRASMLRRLSDAGCSLLQLTRGQRDLENVFLQLSEASPARPLETASVDEDRGCSSGSVRTSGGMKG